MMNQKEELLKIVKLTEAKEKGDEIFVLSEQIDELKQKIEDIKPADLSTIENKLDTLQEKVDEPIEVEVDIT